LVTWISQKIPKDVSYIRRQALMSSKIWAPGAGFSTTGPKISEDSGNYWTSFYNNLETS
jgi:hypothetical protein